MSAARIITPAIHAERLRQEAADYDLDATGDEEFAAQRTERAATYRQRAADLRALADLIDPSPAPSGETVA